VRADQSVGVMVEQCFDADLDKAMSLPVILLPAVLCSCIGCAAAEPC
jgi:hypothetical protein